MSIKGWLRLTVSLSFLTLIAEAYSIIFGESERWPVYVVGVPFLGVLTSALIACTKMMEGS